MRLTKANRARIRLLQNKLIKLAEQHNIPNTYAVNSYYPEPKLYQLVDHIWPQYEHIIKQAICKLERNSAK